MKKSILAVSFLASLVIFSGCSGNLEDISLAPLDNMALDIGKGFEPYSGGVLPPNPDFSLKTYRFSFTFDLMRDKFPTWPCLVIGPSTFPYKLYLNGQLLWRYGDDGNLERTRVYPSALIHIPPSMLADHNRVEISAQISVERISLMDLAITDSRSGSSYVFWRNFFMSQLQAGGLAIGILLLIYFMFMFTLGKGKDRRYLWFSLFCGFFSMACVNVVFNHLAVSDTLLMKIGRVGFLFCAVLLSFYVMETTGLLAKKRWVKTLEIVTLSASSLWIVLQGDFVSVNDAFHAALQIVITPNLVFCLVLLVMAIARQGIKAYAILCAGFAGIIGTSLFDMIAEGSFITPYAWALVYGYEWFVVCVFLELALKQETVSRTAIRQAEDLNQKNAILQNVFGHLRSGSDTLTSSTEDLAVSTREISATGKQQAVAVREIVSTMEGANSLLARISQKSELVHRDSQDTARRADEGAANVKTALEKLEAVIGRISESISLITDFNTELGSITGLIKLIEGIATKVRIIAFNASLEAVAAGEAGKNFCIVADEVKRLSDSTMASVKTIRERVNSLIAMSDNVVQVSQQGYMALEQSWDIASGMGESFSGIAEAAESSALATADIDGSIREETSAFEQIVQTLKEISSGINNFVDSATHTSETTDTLNGIAEGLHDVIVRYSGDFEGDGKAEPEE